jgi:ketosteroid isomerase-like protein
MRSLTILLLLQVSSTCGQEFSNPNLQGLVDAERAFSLMAKQTNTRDAFLYYFADDVVTSSEGQGPRLGKKHLEQQTPNESWLYWEPAFADIAASGDFGFDFGPWEFRPKKSDTSPVAIGQFVTVWKKNAAGEWRAAVDIGIAHPTPDVKRALSTSTIVTKTSIGNPNEFPDTEKKFLAYFEQRSTASYTEFLSKETKFFRPGSTPITTKEKVLEHLKSTTIKVVYTFMDGDTASSGDLAYVYGKASVETIKDGAPQSKIHSYLRIWKKEDGKNWKIVLDLISN